MTKQITQHPLTPLIIAADLDCLHICTECFRLNLSVSLLHTLSSDSLTDCYGSLGSWRVSLVQGQFNPSFKWRGRPSCKLVPGSPGHLEPASLICRLPLLSTTKRNHRKWSHPARNMMLCFQSHNPSFLIVPTLF